MSKNQVVHEQKFKDLLSSTCLTSSERRLMDLESEVKKRPRGNIFAAGFFLFSCIKDENANIGIFVQFVKNPRKVIDV